MGAVAVLAVADEAAVAAAAMGAGLAAAMGAGLAAAMGAGLSAAVGAGLAFGAIELAAICGLGGELTTAAAVVACGAVSPSFACFSWLEIADILTAAKVTIATNHEAARMPRLTGEASGGSAA